MESDQPPASDGKGLPGSLNAQEILALERVGLLMQVERRDHMMAPGSADEALRQLIPAEAAGGALRCRVRTVDDAAAVFLITGLSRQACAQMLGLPLAAIDERISAGTLLALSDGAETRLLVTQFHANRELPGLSTVLSAFPDGTDATIAGLWLILPNPDLADIDGNDELLPALSPRDFLINGGSPARVALLAHTLDYKPSGC